MKYVLNPSLEHIALVKVAATLWNEDDRNLLTKFCIPSANKEFKSKWVEMEAIAIKKVAYLPLPEHMKEKLLCFIRPVGFQIAKWNQFLYRGCDINVDLPNEFHWMPQGTIDKKKMAQVMVKDERIDIATRYKLACIFCLEDEIPILWEKIPEDCKISFYNEEDPMDVKQKELVILWTYHIKGELDKINNTIQKMMDRRCSPYQLAFEFSARDGNRVATEYFLQKLTAVERKESLVKAAASVAFGREDPLNERTGFLKQTYSEILCFLLSQLDEDQQMEVFKQRSNHVLVCLLDYPFQIFFMDTLDRMWHFFPKIFYHFMFIRLTGNTIEGYKDFDYRKLFHDFWEHSPDDYKEYILNDKMMCRIISELLKIRDEDNIKLIFRDATPDIKRSLMYDDDDILDTCKKLMKGQMRLLKDFIKECLPSMKDLVEFREYFDEFHVNEFLFTRSSWQHRFLSVIDGIISEFKKRKTLESNPKQCTYNKMKKM